MSAKVTFVIAALAALVLAGHQASSQQAKPSPAATLRTAEAAGWAATVHPPKPHEVKSRSGPVSQAVTDLVAFETAPFPYHGLVPATAKPFLDVEVNGHRGHQTARGHVHWEADTYSDRRSLLHIPKGFDIRRPGVIVVYLHGHGARLERDVRDRQRLPQQISRSGINAVLVAPQLAVDAADSSAGRFWEPGGFGRFMAEAAQHLARMHGDPKSVRTFASLPVVIVAYSGGYLPTAWALSRGGLNKRIKGIVLLDALYGELGRFTDWIERDRHAFFVSAYAGSTKTRNEEMQRILAERQIATLAALPPRVGAGTVAFLPTAENHRSFVTKAWVREPVRDVLARLDEYRLR